MALVNKDLEEQILGYVILKIPLFFNFQPEIAYGLLAQVPFPLFYNGFRTFQSCLLFRCVLNYSRLEGEIIESLSQFYYSLLLRVEEIPLIIQKSLEIVLYLNTRHSQQGLDVLFIEFSYLTVGKRSGLMGLGFWVYLRLESAVDQVVHAMEIWFLIS